MSKPKILAPDGRPARGRFNLGRVLGPSGQPAAIEEIARKNTRNRDKLRAKVGPWQPHFKIGLELILKKIHFVVREKYDDIMILGVPKCMDDEKGWYTRFRMKEIFPLFGYEFRVFDLMFNSLHLICRGPTGKKRKGR